MFVGLRIYFKEQIIFIFQIFFFQIQNEITDD